MSSPSQDSPVDQFLRCVCSRQMVRANELLAINPELARANIYAACAAGELGTVEGLLSADADASIRPGGPNAWPPLLYTCFSGFLRTDPSRADRIVVTARLLVEHGADPNCSYLWKHQWPLSALYGAAGFNNHAGLTAILLKAGANPNDNESLYHSAEFRDLACTRLLLEAGAKIENTNAVHRKLDYDDLEGLRLFLDHGASANLRSKDGTPLVHWAITNDRRVAFLELLRERGADLTMINGEGLTPYRLALRLGHSEAVEFLTRVGATNTLSDKDMFVAACARGDLDAAEALLEQNPVVLKSLEPPDLGLLANAAWRGKLEAVSVMIETGFPVAATGKNGETALHCAAWMGFFPIIKILLTARPPLEVRESEYDATPLDWALHGSVNSRDNDGNYLNPRADYPNTVEALLEAGAKLRECPDGDLPEGVKAVLARFRKP